MYISSDFEDRLRDMFDGRFRVRWSSKRNEFQLEQRVAHAQVLEPPPVNPDAQSIEWDTFDDNYIRARDGYFYVMSIRSGDRMPCPVCGHDVKVPVFETAEAHCTFCQEHGRDGRYAAAHFELDDRFLNHIRYLDPFNDGPIRVRQRIRAKQLERNSRMLKEELDTADYRTMFNKNQVENNPMTGYGPKGRQVEGERLIGA